LNEIISLPEVKNVRSKTWLLIAVFAVIALALGFWWNMGEKEEPRQEAAVVKEDNATVIKEDKIVPKTEPGECTRHKKMTPEDAPPVPKVLPAAGLEEPEQLQKPEPEPELVTIQGVLEVMDPCSQTILVDGTTIDVSLARNFPWYRTLRNGDFVEVTYREYKAGNILNSIELIQERLE
jgi:type IV secretory pathway VirB10-like protein